MSTDICLPFTKHREPCAMDGKAKHKVCSEELKSGDDEHVDAANVKDTARRLVFQQRATLRAVWINPNESQQR
jgi:hypothetical protein